MHALGLINRAFVAVLAFAAMVVAVYHGSNYTARFYLADIAERGQSTLRLSIAGLQGVLSRFEYLPGLIAEDRSVKAVLARPELAGLARQTGDELKQVAAETGAANIMVLDAAGRTVATSRPEDRYADAAGLGHMPYFRAAMEGRLGRYFAVDADSGTRSYTFAGPVRDGNRVIGAVAVEVDLDGIDTGWSGPAHEIVVTDARDIVFMASRPGWRFKALEPLSDADRAAIAETGQYGGRDIRVLDIRHAPQPHSLADLVTVTDEDWGRQYLVQSAEMPEAGWTVHILSNTESARTQAAIFTIIAALLMLILVMFMVFLWQRRARLMERIALQREAQDMLERRVAERTASLNEANKRLVQEITEREAAEQELRRTQEDLVQAGKLAALGQMSTALSHEFNQPLAAIRSYADNAAVLLERDRIEDARDNVERIAALTDRMAAISKHLRNFARKPDEKKGAVSLRDVVRDTLELLEGRIAAARVDVVVDDPGEEVFVVAGHVRLQQVLINLVANAIDAMSAVHDPRLAIAWRPAAGTGWVEIRVRDRGPGVPGDIAGRVFDPFFTTKGVGQGLGLGLSISFNIIKDFGGTLRVANHPAGGAEFIVRLERAAEGEGIAAE